MSFPKAEAAFLDQVREFKTVGRKCLRYGYHQAEVRSKQPLDSLMPPAGCFVATSSNMKRFPPERIVVAADLSAPSMVALNAAKVLARGWNSSLEIVHVRQPPNFTPAVGPNSMPLSLPPRPEESWPSVAAKLRKKMIGFPPDRLKLSVLRGWPSTALVDLTLPDRADLMVMGTHGYAGLDRLLTGSVSEAVIRHARIPVLAVPEGQGSTGVSRVLAPWNGRPYATRALRWAREYARSLCATLDVLYVRNAGEAPDHDWASLDLRLLSILGSGPDWTLHMRSGEARARIITEANSGRYDLVVLSAHRRPFAADLALGTTVERLLRHSHVPVLAVPSGIPHPRPVKRLAALAAARLY